MKKSALLAIALLLSLAVLVPASAFAESNRNAYVTNNINGTVGVIDPNTNTVTATIKGFLHPFCVSVSPNGKLLYVCNTNNTISVVDTATNSIRATISLGGALGFIGNEGAGPVVAFSRHGERAFVATSGGGVHSELIVIDTEKNAILSRTSFGATFLLAVAVSPNSDSVYLASSSGIVVVHPDGHAATTTIAPGHEIFDLALSRNGEKLYGSDMTASGVLVVNTDKNTVETTVPVPAIAGGAHTFVMGLALTRDSRHLYAAALNPRPANSKVLVIDTRNNSVNTTITANGLSLTSLAATTNGGKILATNAVLSVTEDSTVVVIDTKDNMITGSIKVGLFSDVIGTQHGGDDDGDHGDDGRRGDDGHGKP